MRQEPANLSPPHGSHRIAAETLGNRGSYPLEWYRSLHKIGRSVFAIFSRIVFQYDELTLHDDGHGDNQGPNHTPSVASQGRLDGGIMLVEVGGVGVLVGMFHVLLLLARYFRLGVL